MSLRLAGPTIGMITNTWQRPFRLGAARIWYDATNGVVRKKNGSNPTSEIDGNFWTEG